MYAECMRLCIPCFPGRLFSSPLVETWNIHKQGLVASWSSSHHTTPIYEITYTATTADYKTSDNHTKQRTRQNTSTKVRERYHMSLFVYLFSCCVSLIIVHCRLCINLAGHMAYWHRTLELFLTIFVVVHCVYLYVMIWTGLTERSYLACLAILLKLSANVSELSCGCQEEQHCCCIMILSWSRLLCQPSWPGIDIRKTYQAAS